MDNPLVSVIAAIIAIPIILVGYLLLSEWLVARLPRRWQSRARPYLWILPAVGFATVFMVIPTINTIWLSFLDRKSEAFVGLANYQYFFTNPGTLGSIKNSLLWLVFFTGGVVIGGLLIAVMFDRVRYESWAKLAVFLPLPISAVAASIIWKFMFEYQPAGQVQERQVGHLFVRPSNDPGQRDHQPLGRFHICAEKAQEVLPPEHQGFDRLHGDHARRARPAVQQRQLAEAVAGTKDRQHRFVARFGR